MSMFAMIERASGRAGNVLQGMRTLWVSITGAKRSRTIASLAAPARTDQEVFRERQDQLVGFYSKYEDLVELLCDSAQYGPDQRMEARYGELRQFMQRNYDEVRPYVVAYLEFEVSDMTSTLDQYGKPSDAFEGLFMAPTLQEQLRGDDGHMISRIMRTREALNRYAEQLRRLAA